MNVFNLCFLRIIYFKIQNFILEIKIKLNIKEYKSKMDISKKAKYYEIRH